MSTKKSAWQECLLKDVITVKKGKKPKDLYSEYQSGLMPYIDIKCFEKNIIDNYGYSDKMVIYDSNENHILLVWDGARSGLVGEFEGVGIVCSTTALIITSINKNFLKYYLNSKYTFLNKNTKGTGIPHINPDKLLNLKILVPPLEEQKLIVEKIESEFQKIDNALNKLNIIKEQIKQYKQSVLKYAFDENNSFAKGSNYEPYEWEEKILDDVCYINPTTIIPEDFNDDTEVSFLPMANVEACTNNYTENIEKYQKVKKGYTKFQENDILFAKITPCMENGKICVINKLKSKIGFGSTEFHVIRNKENVFIDFIYYFVSSEEFRMNAKQKMTGAVGQKRVPASYLTNHIIKIPNIELQKTIADNIQNIFDKVDNIENNINENIDKLNVLKQAVLKKAFEGKLI
ncbi:restriction endonuclease subunit S [Brachyspira intermedia]|uniref:restriction endonuclease subunit S n=1 Tax=Brachyspira intermedia TaxID=84377 RepID=UPI003004624F